MIWILGYLAFGLLLLDYMCPFWHPFERLIGALVWPVSAVIGIFVMVKESKDTRPDDELLLLVAATAAIARDAVGSWNEKKGNQVQWENGPEGREWDG